MQQKFIEYLLHTRHYDTWDISVIQTDDNVCPCGTSILAEDDGH